MSYGRPFSTLLPRPVFGEHFNFGFVRYVFKVRSIPDTSITQELLVSGAHKLKGSKDSEMKNHSQE